MALRELLRRGYWNAAGSDGSDSGSSVDAGDDHGDDSAVDNEAQANDDAPQTMAEAIAQNFKSDDSDNDSGNTDEKPDTDDKSGDVVDSLPDSDAIADEKDNKDDKDIYEPPEGLDNSSDKTKERFHELVSQNKKKDSRIQELETENDQIISMISGTGATAQQFGELLEISSLMYHPEQSNPKEAIDKLYSAASQIARANGIDLPGYDPLEGHDDLRQKVENMDMTLDAAKELAQHRNRQHIQNERTQEESTQRQEQAAYQSRVAEGKDNIRKYLENLQDNDIDFEAKAEYLMDAVKGIAQEVPPEKWVEHLDRHYKTIDSIVKNRLPPKDPAPLRSGGGGSGVKAPTDMQEAISQGLKLGT